MFTNRKQAALQLAKALEKYSNQNVLVLGIARGGIETAYYIARQLNAELSFLIVRKLSHLQNPEYALGAMAEDGTVYYNPGHKTKISQEMLDNIEEQQQQEIERRKQVFRKVQVLPEINNRTIIIADDGIATGATIFAAIKMCKQKGAAKIIVAAPVCAKSTANELIKEADEVIMLTTPDQFMAVAQFYESFRDLSDQETLDFLKRWEKRAV
ncbi:phosphoribosyltransferase [Niastella koreensis]|uniref:Phosphoribosyltransferase n=2 Tax=Niastella koreensis TaxID=354356 RepID=G8TBU6_NIAKG|nr:phosphoribosyltransferase family protein [Niastella koreensis]AEV98228.1 phosphoribosyltransferase [Niastella koreensis GR20-10]OQP53313.1 phosphoribosyltransferase [Niastella koreensis]